jgi:Flp pilus assembly protein TadD
VRSFFVKGSCRVGIGAGWPIGIEIMHDRSWENGFQGQETRGPLLTAAGAALLLALSLITYARNGLWQDPIRLWEDAVGKSPRKARVRYNLATAYEARGVPDLAEAAYRAVLDLEPDHVMAHNNLGNVYANTGRFTEAAREMQTAVRLNPNAPLSRDNLGYIYFRLGRIDDAVREYQAAIQLAPESAEIRNNLGYVYFTQGRFEDADEQFRIALKLKPGFDAAIDNKRLLDRERSKQRQQR